MNERNMPKVNIVLATYNGAKYLSRQLDSILAQTYSNFSIIARDDGSSDATVEILKEYQRKLPEGKLVILDNHGENLKPPKSFYAILTSEYRADYYSFCDQDDEWLPEKISWAVEKLSAEPDQLKPLLYLSSHDYYTADGAYMRSFPRQKEHIPLDEVLYHTPGSGFTVVFNETLRKKMLDGVDPGTEMHDRYMIRGAVCFGTLIYDPRSSAHHIRHDAAVTAEDSSNHNLLVHFMQDEILSDTAVIAKRDIGHFYEQFCEELSEHDKKVLRLFASKNSFGRYFQKLCYPHRLRARLLGEIALRILFLIGKI